MVKGDTMRQVTIELVSMMSYKEIRSPLDLHHLVLEEFDITVHTV